VEIKNAVYPSKEQLQSLTEAEVEGPIAMVNLLKFKEKAQYADGREASLSGLEAYGLYGKEMQKIVEGAGGRFIFSGAVGALAIGETSDLWDAVAIVEYPSPEAFLKLAMSPEVQEIGVHRQAGLEGQLLIQTIEGADVLSTGE